MILLFSVVGLQLHLFITLGHASDTPAVDKHGDTPPLVTHPLHQPTGATCGLVPLRGVVGAPPRPSRVPPGCIKVSSYMQGCGITTALSRVLTATWKNTARTLRVGS